MAASTTRARRKQNALRRQWQLFQLLCQERGYTVQELAKYFRVSDKTVRRDLELLVEAGIELEEQTGEYGRKSYRAAFVAKAGQLHFGWDQALAIALAPQFLLPFAGTPLYQSMKEAAEKVLSLISEKGREYVRRMAASMFWTYCGMPNPAGKWRSAVDVLTLALEDRHIVKLTYQSNRRRQPAVYFVHPYGFIVHRQSLYLVGYSEQHGAVRHFKLTRVINAELTPSPAVIPPDFDMREHLSGSLGVFGSSGRPRTIRIRFSPNVARYVSESVWHSSQRFDWTPEGGLILELELSDTTELKSWVLSFGSHAEVLEPEELRREVEEELRAALGRYARRPVRPRERDRQPNLALLAESSGQARQDQGRERRQTQLPAEKTPTAASG